MNPATPQPFVPLAPGSPAVSAAPADARLKILSHPSQAQPFKPLATGDSAVRHAPAGSLVGCGTPTVSLQREGDRVTQIRVQCACGQIIELACVY